MHFHISFTTTALLSSIALAAPLTPHYPNIPITFNGAAGTGYSLVVVANAVAIPTNNDLSITSISMEGRASFTCTAYGIDGSETFLVANQQNVPVGPPQVQSSVSCSAPPEYY